MRSNSPADLDLATTPVEKMHIEGKTHAEGVNARATRDEETAAGGISVEVSETEQARPPVNRHPNPPSKDGDRRQAGQARCQS